MGDIQNRFAELLEAKRRRENKSWTYREIQDEIGINPATLTRFAKQRHKQFDAETLIKLCEFLDCTIGELLILPEEEDNPGQALAALAT